MKIRDLSFVRHHQNDRARRHTRAGKIRYALAGWLLGLPTIVILIMLFWRGCDW
jgi:hypothetical protein